MGDHTPAWVDHHRPMYSANPRHPKHFPSLPFDLTAHASLSVRITSHTQSGEGCKRLARQLLLICASWLEPSLVTNEPRRPRPISTYVRRLDNKRAETLRS
jgi:hypothetical protein